MFNWLKRISNKVFGRKSETQLSLERGLADLEAGRVSECCMEFQGISSLVNEKTRELTRKMEQDLFDPTYEITYKVNGPRAKKKTKKKKKKVQPVKGKYGSQKKASSRKKSKPTKKGN